MKYIDADLLRKDVKRLEKAAHKSALGCTDSETRKFHEGKDFAYQHVGVLINSLQQEQPEQHTRGYDEDYLNEKIAKATKSWKGVDVDKFMDEMRGREPETDLEKEVNRYYFDNFAYISSDQPTLSIVTNIARHFAEWGAEHFKK